MIVSLLSIIFIIIIQINSEDTFDCTGHEDDSFHPMYNIDNCRYYWHCIYVNTVYMRAVKRVCPAGTEFDVHLKECEISSLVKCIPFKSPPSTTTPKQSKVLSSTVSLEQLFENLIALEEKTKINNTITTIRPLKYMNRRRNLILNILTSNEHKIRHFSLNQTHGLLIHCNEIRRRQLRDIIFRTTTTTTTNSSKISNISSRNIPYDLLSLIIFINLFLIFTKISD